MLTRQLCIIMVYINLRNNAESWVISSICLLKVIQFDFLHTNLHKRNMSFIKQWNFAFRMKKTPAFDQRVLSLKNFLYIWANTRL